MSEPNNGQVSVFHFTSRISTAKIRKYKMATERGMGPSKTNGLRASHASKTSKSATPNENDAGPSAGEASTSMQPPAKKPRLKINPPRRPSDVGDTIAVSRPKRPNQPIRFRYSTDMDIAEDPQPEDSKPIEPAQAVVSPVPSSGLSSLSSAPLSDKETSPFQDPKPAAGRESYGDFMSYYVDGGDEEPAPADVPIPKPAAKPAPKRARKTSSKVQKDTPNKMPTPSSQHPVANMPPPPAGAHAPPPQQAITHPQHAMPPQQCQGPPRPHQGSPSYPPRPQPMQRSSMPPPPQRALPIPQPIIQFSDINHIPKPTQPDTIALMVNKLEDLSAALTTFGGVPAIPRTPPMAPRPAPVAATPKPKPVPESSVEEAANPLDNFLSLFGAGDDDDASDKDPLDCQLAAAGTPDGPLTHGIVFIQNALKSWAQQRISQAYQQQYIQQQQQHQIAAQRRGPGRPRKFDDVVELLPPNPIISMDLASTPEGQAIIAFQAVLHSGCLQVNAKLPIELSRALRHLYMQIDHLINQGEKTTPQDWHCMSYGAQISAHRMRVEKMKMVQMRAQEEMMRQNGFAQQHITGPMDTPHPSQYPANAAQAARAHEMELERRRSVQHANQQPYIRQQHLNPLQLGSQMPGAPDGTRSQSPGGRQPPGGAGGPPGPTIGEHPPVQRILPSQPQLDPAQMSPEGTANGAGPVHLDKMKMYMPGFFPRSGQNMKYSFSPTNEHVAQASGPQGIPSHQVPGQNVPNRGPLSVPPVPHTARNAKAPMRHDRNWPVDHEAVVSSTRPVKSVEKSSAPPSRTSLTPLTPAAPVEATLNGNFRSYATTAPTATTNGFTAVNAPKPQTSIPVRPALSESPETIKVASKRPSSALSPSESPAPSAKRSRKSVKSVDRDDSKVLSSDGDGEPIVLK